MDLESVVVENGVEVMYRYKYLPFNEYSLKTITEGTLKFTCPLDFNDPFDCSPAYDPKSIDNLHKYRPDLLKKVGDSKGLSPAKRIMNRGRFVQNIRNVVESGEYVKTLVSGISVFCVSRTPNNTLMWSHYADHHRGFLVELRIAMDTPDHHLTNLIPYQVSYQDKRPIVNWATACGKNLEEYFYTKSRDWDYEQEERVINPGQRSGIYPYSREHFLCSVIAGARMSPDDHQQLQRAVTQASSDIGKTIPLYQAKLATHSYRVYVPDHPFPEVSREI
ncbi:DUF2971 domain-containing protein [Zobellella aerophila]